MSLFGVGKLPADPEGLRDRRDCSVGQSGGELQRLSPLQCVRVCVHSRWRGQLVATGRASSAGLTGSLWRGAAGALGGL